MVDVVVVAEVVGVVEMEVPEVAERDFDASSSSSLECEWELEVVDNNEMLGTVGQSFSFQYGLNLDLAVAMSTVTIVTWESVGTELRALRSKSFRPHNLFLREFSKNIFWSSLYNIRSSFSHKRQNVNTYNTRGSETRVGKLFGCQGTSPCFDFSYLTTKAKPLNNSSSSFFFYFLFLSPPIKKKNF